MSWSGISMADLDLTFHNNKSCNLNDGCGEGLLHVSRIYCCVNHLKCD